MNNEKSEGGDATEAAKTEALQLIIKAAPAGEI